MASLFERFKTGLTKTRETLTHRLKAVFSGPARDTTRNDLTDVLLSADLGMALTQRLIASLKEPLQQGADDTACREWLKQEMKQILKEACPLHDSGKERIEPISSGCQTIAFFGINGVGKTTTIGKMAGRFRTAGKTVLLAAGDTFRAGAIEQLSLWGTRVGAGVIRSTPGADPASVVFDAVRAAHARGSDYLLIDTAGRLQTNHNLMEELKKIIRVIDKGLSHAPYERLFVLDAVTGQNALSQAKQFHEAVGITGLIMTKLDSTAHGGVLISIVEQLRVPVLYVGMGEAMEDLVPFDREAYVDALF